MPSYRNLGPSPSLQAGLFYLVGSVYLAYACIAASWLARRASSHARTTHSWPFRICGISLLLNVLGGPLIRTVSITMRWTVGIGLPHGVEAVGTWVLAAGILGVDLGLCGIALVAAMETRRHNRRARRDFADLGALWVLLYERFPWIALPGTTRAGPRRRIVFLRPIYAFERRCTECRDGLWLLSPWASEDVPGASTDTEAGLSALRH